MARIVLIVVAICVGGMANADALAGPTSVPASRLTALPTIYHSRLSLHCTDAIHHATRFLLARQQPDGSWNDDDGPDPDCGHTALVTLALLSAGVDHQTPELIKAIDFLRKARTIRTYSLALRACVYAQLPESLRKTALRADLAALEKNMLSTEPHDGLFTYGPPNGSGDCDYSNSQYGILGIWYAAEAGLEVSDSFWRRAERGWRMGQHKDGGWSYTPDDAGSSYASMTAAGAATLFITNDYLHANDAYDLLHLTTNRPLERAVDWLGANFAVDRNLGKDAPLADENNLLDALVNPPPPASFATWGHYMLFGYERVGEASGLTHFGTHAWFTEGAQYLCDTQLYDGSWPAWGNMANSPEVDTAYSLLFLSRGQSPVVIQKLKWGKRWNNRPLDVADYIKFLRHESERHVNWQIADASAGVAELREAPLLWAASDRSMELKDAEAAAVKEYILEGGTLICANEGKTDDFARSVEPLFEQMFPPYKFATIAPDDVMLKGNFSTKAWTDPIRVLSNGIRKLVVLYPSGDVPWKFQVTGGAPTNRLSPYTPTANLWLNNLGGTEPLAKGECTWIEREDIRPAVPRPAPPSMEVARLQYTGNWNPEPAGWARLANLLHNAGELELTTTEIPITSLDAEKYRIAHLTGTAEVKLTSSQEVSLRAYLDRGGLLLFDAAGGSPEAASSMQAILAKLYPDSKNEPLPTDHPIYTGQGGAAPVLDSTTYRRSDEIVVSTVKLPRLRGITVGGRLVAIVSAEDLSAGLVGYPMAGFAGYSPGSSVEVVRAVLEWVRKTQK